MTDCFVVIIESGNDGGAGLVEAPQDLLLQVQHKADLVVTDGRITKSRVPGTQIGACWNPASHLLPANHKFLLVANASDLRAAWRAMEESMPVKSVRPITPDEAEANRKMTIPPEVIEVFNQLIVAHLSAGRATILQDEAVARICEECSVDRTFVYNSHWLDIESIFEEAGWSVVYDRPAYCETYPATFTFTRK
jgi:hypothetical protein